MIQENSTTEQRIVESQALSQWLHEHHKQFDAISSEVGDCTKRGQALLTLADVMGRTVERIRALSAEYRMAELRKLEEQATKRKEQDRIINAISDYVHSNIEMSRAQGTTEGSIEFTLSYRQLTPALKIHLTNLQNSDPKRGYEISDALVKTWNALIVEITIEWKDR